MPLRSLQRFLKLQSAAGILLMASALAALACANLPGLAKWYEVLLGLPIEVTLGPLELRKNFLLIVNDGLMAIFFLLVGLEIKREILDGELSDRGKIALPIVASIGGMIVPAAFYLAITQGDAVAQAGWAIPAATDIAFSLGVLSLLGTRVPLGLKVFLTAVAIVDDLGAILIIAVFHTGQLSIVALALAVSALGMLIVLNRLRVVHLAAYFLVGTVMWLCVLKSGVHATLAGVALAFTIPFRVPDVSGDAPARRLENTLHPWVTYMILPLFAFANSGVSFAGVRSDVWFGPVTLGIAAGLVVGKTVGVFGFSGLAVLTRLGRLPREISWRMLLGVSVLAGIGFTMSLFIGLLAFEGQSTDYAVAVRLGVFGGSVVSALLGLGILRFSRPVCPGTGGSSKGHRQERSSHNEGERHAGVAPHILEIGNRCRQAVWVSGGTI